MSISFDKKSNQIKYTKDYSISPFNFNVFPQNRDRFCIVILSPPNSDNLNHVFKLVLNSFIDEIIISPKKLQDVQLEFTDKNQSIEQLKLKLAILDLTEDNKFKNLHSNIIPCTKTGDKKNISYNGEWAINHFYKNILIPNTLQQDKTEIWKKNFSHTIWLATAMSEVPKLVLTNTNILFCTESEQTTDFFKTRMNANYKSTIDQIFVISYTLKSDPSLMILDKKRFLPTDLDQT